MLHRVAASLIAVLLLLGSPVTQAQAQNQNSERKEEIRTLLAQRDRQIKRVLGTRKTFTSQQREQLKDLINGFIDFRAMAQTALGPHWEELTPAKREEFVDVFSEIVRTQSLSDLNAYRSEITYDTIEVRQDSAFVQTATTYKGTPIDVDYVLGYDQDAGAWRANDVILDEVSTAQNYARSFQNVIRQRGFDTLMKSLRKKLDKTQASK